MKKILFAFLLMLSFLSKSQSYMITMYDTIKYGNCGDLLLPTVTFSNTSGSEIVMHMNRIVKNIPAGWRSCFCNPTCLPETQATLDFTISAGGSKTSPPWQNVSPNFGTDSIPGVGRVVVVFNQVGFTNYDTVYFRGVTANLAGINEYNKEPFLLFPNPVCDMITIKGLEKPIQAVTITDGTGRAVLNYRPNTLEKEIKLNTDGLNAGHYSMTLQCADGTVYRKKIIKE